MKIAPIHDRIAVRAQPDEAVSHGGIILPANRNQEKTSKGVVVAVGPGVPTESGFIPVGVKEGDVVVYGRHSGVDVTVGGEEFRLLREAEVLCVIEG